MPKFKRRKTLFIEESRTGKTETDRGTVIGYLVCFKDGSRSKEVRCLGNFSALISAQSFAMNYASQKPCDYSYRE